MAHDVVRCNSLGEMQPLFNKIQATVAAFAPQLFNYMTNVMKIIKENHAARVAHFYGSLFPSQSFIFDRSTGIHRDWGNDFDLLDVLLVGGTATGHRFVIPELGIDSIYEPGTLILFRGAAFAHGVKVRPDGGGLGKGIDGHRLVMASWIHSDVLTYIRNGPRGHLVRNIPVQVFPPFKNYAIHAHGGAKTAKTFKKNEKLAGSKKQRRAFRLEEEEKKRKK